MRGRGWLLLLLLHLLLLPLPLPPLPLLVVVVLLLLLLLLLLHLLSRARKALIHHRHHPHGHHHVRRADSGLRRGKCGSDGLRLRELQLQLLVLHLRLLAHVCRQRAVVLQRERDLLDLRLQLRYVIHDHLGHRQVRWDLFLRVQTGLGVVGRGSLCVQ